MSQGDSGNAGSAHGATHMAPAPRPFRKWIVLLRVSETTFRCVGYWCVFGTGRETKSEEGLLTWKNQPHSQAAEIQLKMIVPATLVSPPAPGKHCRLIHLYLRRRLSVSGKHNVAFYGLCSAKPHSVRMTNLLLSPANHFTSGKQQGWRLRNSRSLPFLNIEHADICFFFFSFFVFLHTFYISGLINSLICRRIPPSI